MTANKSLKVGGILLAAGGSSRLGEPKQFLEFEGKTLLRRAAEAMVNSICDPVVAVLGAETEKANSEIADLPLTICLNQEWRLGMSSSIKVGLKELLLIAPDIEAVVITLCDQPFVNAETIDRLAAKFATTDKLMIAAEYDGVPGVPALFAKVLFGELFKLEGDKGARDLLRAPDASIAMVEIKEAAIDIDTRDDIDHLTAR